MAFNPPPWTPPMDGEANIFIGEQLPSKYPGGIDDLGLTRWPSDWRTYRGNGADAAEAFRRVAQNIDEIRAGQPTTSWSGPYDVPWPMNLDVDGPRFLDALRGVYLTDPSGPRPVDPTGYCRWSSDYRIHRANGSGHDAAVRRVTNDIRKIWGLPPLDSGPTKNRIRGVLRQTEWRTFDDDGDKIVQMCHAMSLFALFVRNPDKAKRQAVAVAQRYGGVRVCNVLGYWDRNRPGHPDRWVAWKGKEVTPFGFMSYGQRSISPTADYYGKYREFLTMLFDAGLKIMDDRGDLNAWSRSQKLQHMTELGRLYRSLPFGREVLGGLWGINEAWQNGASRVEGGVQLCVDMVNAFKDAAGWLPDVVGLSAPGGTAPDGHEYGAELPDDINAWAVSPATAATIHGSRAINEHLIPHYFGYGYDRTIRNNRKKVWNTEPLGGGRGVSVGELNDVELLCGMHAQMLATGQESTFMSGNGVFGGAPASYDGEVENGILDAPIEDMPGYEEVSRISELLPSDIHAFDNIFHSGSLFADRRVVAANDPTRFDTSKHADGRFVAVVHTFNGQARPLELQRDCSEFKVYDIVTHGVDRDGPASRGTQFRHNGRVRLVVGRLA